jgi:hypothetical protein
VYLSSFPNVANVGILITIFHLAVFEDKFVFDFK